MSSHYWNGSQCRIHYFFNIISKKLLILIPLLVLKKPYGTFCSSSSQCDETAGLKCPTSTGTCNCPFNSTTIFCDCSFGEYYDNTTNMCSMSCLISNYLF